MSSQALNKEDDWTGLTDARARRLRQNRLNKRAWRKSSTRPYFSPHMTSSEFIDCCQINYLEMRAM